MLVIVLTMSKSERKMISKPDTISRGFIYARESEDLLRDINRIAEKTVNDLPEQDKSQWNVIKQSIKKSLGQFLFEKTKRKPMILPIIIEI